MTYFRSLILYVFPLTFAGCAIHPLPEDYEGNRTVEIVEHIRCEARRAIQDNAIGFLRYEHNDLLADQLEHDRKRFIKFKTNILNAQEKAFYDRYIRTGFAMAFTLGMTEENVASTQLDFLRLVSNGTFSLAVNASSNRKRDASRHFYTVDTFQSLLDNDKVCADDNPDAIPMPQNPLYPVTGAIGLSELVGSFLQLNQDGVVLAAEKDKAPVFADTLTFTSTFSGSITPKINLTPTGRHFQVGDASLTNSATRTDANMVLVGMSFEPTKSAKKSRGVVGSPLVAGFSPFATVFAKENISASEILAVQAITQTRIDTYLERSVQVVPQQ